MKILAFDISSSSTGYSVLEDKKLKKYGLIELSSKSSHGKKLYDFEQELVKIILQENPDLIIIEDIFKGRNANTFKVLSLFRGVAIKAIYGIIKDDPISLMASEARSLVGCPNSKEEAFDFVIANFKVKFDFDKHNDIADSIVLGLAGHILKSRGIDAKSIRSAGRKKRRRRKRNKKSV